MIPKPGSTGLRLPRGRSHESEKNRAVIAHAGRLLRLSIYPANRDKGSLNAALSYCSRYSRALICSAALRSAITAQLLPLRCYRCAITAALLPLQDAALSADKRAPAQPLSIAVYGAALLSADLLATALQGRRCVSYLSSTLSVARVYG